MKYVMIAVCIFSAAIAVGMISVKIAGNHNPVELIAEHVIDEETGLDVDLDEEVSE